MTLVVNINLVISVFVKRALKKTSPRAYAPCKNVIYLKVYIYVYVLFNTIFERSQTVYNFQLWFKKSKYLKKLYKLLYA